MYRSEFDSAGGQPTPEPRPLVRWWHWALLVPVVLYMLFQIYAQFESMERTGQEEIAALMAEYTALGYFIIVLAAVLLAVAVPLAKRWWPR